MDGSNDAFVRAWQRAQTELTSLFEAQWTNGMLPHIVFNPAIPAGSYWPGPEFWNCSNAAPKLAPRGVQTSGTCVLVSLCVSVCVCVRVPVCLCPSVPVCPSCLAPCLCSVAAGHALPARPCCLVFTNVLAPPGIVQPPVHATAAWLTLQRATDKAAALAWLRQLYPKLVAWMDFLYRERDADGDGLVYIRHPWESGMDNRCVSALGTHACVCAVGFGTGTART